MNGYPPCIQVASRARLLDIVVIRYIYVGSRYANVRECYAGQPRKRQWDEKKMSTRRGE